MSCICVAFKATIAFANVSVATQSDILTPSVFGWITIMQRDSIQPTWNRTWQEYRDGFFNADTDFWIGLERMHQLSTSNSYRVRFEFYQTLNRKFWLSGEFWSFVIDGEDNGYMLHVAGLAYTRSPP